MPPNGSTVVERSRDQITDKISAGAAVGVPVPVGARVSPAYQRFFRATRRIRVGPGELTCVPHRALNVAVHVETKFLWLFRAVEVGEDLNGWEVCWLGGWDPCRVMFVVMVKRVPPRTQAPSQ